MVDFTPSLDRFLATYGEGKPQFVSCSIAADTLTPVAAMLRLEANNPSEYRLLFESVEGGAVRGRYSIIAFAPDQLWRSEKGKPELYDNQQWCADGDDVFESLERFIKQSYIQPDEVIPPMLSGVYGFMGYDMVQYMEPVLDFSNPDTINMPESLYMRPTRFILFDNVKDEALLVAVVRPQEGVDAKGEYQRTCDSLRMLIKLFETSLPLSTQGIDDKQMIPKSHVSKESFTQMVAKAKDYVLAGDVFQVVLSKRLSVDFSASPFSFYRALRRINPSPYLFYMVLDDATLIGSSPEILVRVQDDTVTIRPLAGTRKRGKDEAEDKALATELLADQKECAEHLMLLDLGRNDVGRVGSAGTVNVTEEFEVEKYSHVMHIVSNVEAKLDPKKGFQAIDALKAGFPAGTVSGAPKIRAMEIIEELEEEKRSFYAGTVGYISAHGDTGLMDTCITLRTALVKDGVLTLQAGAGIVYDSDPDAEWQETENKAGALMRAAEEI